MKQVKLISALCMVLCSTGITAKEKVEAHYDKGYLVLESQDSSFSLKLDGRIMLDTGFVDSDKNDFVENTEIRRARLGLKTKFNNTWAGEFDIDFAENDPEIKDMWVSYIGLDNFTFKVGNHKPFFSMAELTTSRWYTFMETPMVTDATMPGRRIGASVSYENGAIFAGASLFGDEIDVDNRDPEGDGSEPGEHEPYSYSGRFVYRPFYNADVTRFFHVGLNYMDLKPQSDDDHKMRLRVRPESRVADYKLVSTGKVKRVSSQRSYGLELAGRYDKFSFQAEYINNTFIRNEDENVDTSGFYVEGSYMIWGQGRAYNLYDGEFGAVYPESNKGNLEVALRYSTIDLNDAEAEVFGGNSDNITLALNWYAHANLVLRLNHTRASMDEFADGDGDFVGDDTVNVTGLRIQYMF